MNNEELLDEDGYPTEKSLDIIKNWEYTKGFGNLLDFIYTIWAYNDAGYWTVNRNLPHEYHKDKLMDVYNISTAGWSGNENIIRALQENRIFWMSCWYQSRRGGHHIFKITKESTSE